MEISTKAKTVPPFNCPLAITNEGKALFLSLHLSLRLFSSPFWSWVHMALPPFYEEQTFIGQKALDDSQIWKLSSFSVMASPETMLGRGQNLPFPVE